MVKREVRNHSGSSKYRSFLRDRRNDLIKAVGTISEPSKILPKYNEIIEKAAYGMSSVFAFVHIKPAASGCFLLENKNPDSKKNKGI
jgi:hypothetical protein